MPQCTLVLVAGRREEQDRGVAAAIQREPSSHCPGVADSPGICPSGGATGRRMKTGSSAFGRTKNRGTVMKTGSSPFGRTKNRGTVTFAGLCGHFGRLFRVGHR